MQNQSVFLQCMVSKTAQLFSITNINGYHTIFEYCEKNKNHSWTYPFKLKEEEEVFFFYSWDQIRQLSHFINNKLTIDHSLCQEACVGRFKVKESFIKPSLVRTVHSSQGNGFSSVIVLLPTCSYGTNNFINKNLLYTAFSRAKDSLYLLGNIKSYNQG